MYEYRCKVIKVIDGDTVDVDIDLGFDIMLRDERVRIMGIDTPESRTRDKVEKKFGLASKARLKELIGDFVTDDGRMVTDILVEEGHAVAYFGGSKEEIQDKHMANRKKLIREGLIDVSLEEAGIQ